MQVNYTQESLWMDGVHLSGDSHNTENSIKKFFPVSVNMTSCEYHN